MSEQTATERVAKVVSDMKAVADEARTRLAEQGRDVSSMKEQMAALEGKVDGYLTELEKAQADQKREIAESRKMIFEMPEAWDREMAKAHPLTRAAVAPVGSMPNVDPDLHLEFQRANDLALIVHAAANRGATVGWDNVSDRSDVRSPIDPATAKRSPVYQRAVHLGRAMYGGGASTGADWLPTIFSSDFYARVEGPAAIWGSFRPYVMPARTCELPTYGAAPTAYLQGEASADAAGKYKASTPGSGSPSLTAKKLAIRVLLSTELTEDAVPGTVEYVRDDITTAMGLNLDDVALNGDSAATHQDTALVTAADDRRKAWNGLRGRAFDLTAGTADKSAAETAAGFRAMLAKMGKYAKDPQDLAVVMSTLYFWLKVSGWTQVETMEKYGPRATIATGELARAFGVRIITSEFISNTAAATGLDTSASTYTSYVIYKPSRWVAGTRQAITLESEKDISSGQTVLVCVWRGVGSYVDTAATDNIVVVAFKLSVS
jgi:HK97 family phage major capsid protein